MSRLEWVFRSVMKTPINTLRNDSFRINFTLVSCGNRYELVLEWNSFGYHVKGPKKFLFPEHYSPVWILQISIALKQQPVFNCFAAAEKTISDRKKYIF